MAILYWLKPNRSDRLAILEQIPVGERRMRRRIFCSSYKSSCKGNDSPEESYTARLISKGINKIAQKVGEEAVELVIEAKDDNEDLFLNEAADLMYHYLVLLIAKGYGLEDVIRVLKERHK